MPCCGWKKWCTWDTKKEAQKKVPVVNASCIGCGACVAVASEVFEMNEEWLSVAKALDNYEWKNVDDAISVCPVNAISWK